MGGPHTRRSDRLNLGKPYQGLAIAERLYAGVLWLLRLFDPSEHSQVLTDDEFSSVEFASSVDKINIE